MALITTIIILLWIIPFTIRAKVKWATIWRMILGFFLGAIFVMIGAVVINTKAETTWLPALGLTGFYFSAGQAFTAGFGEEALKLVFALLCCIKMKSERIIDYILVFGSVGAGFEVIESIAAADNIISLLVRVLFALHVLWLYHEGMQFFRCKNGKRFALLKGYLSVAVLHTLFDLGALAMAAENASDDAIVFGLIFLVVGMIANIVFIFKTMKQVIKESSVPKAV